LVARLEGDGQFSRLVIDVNDTFNHPQCKFAIIVSYKDDIAASGTEGTIRVRTVNRRAVALRNQALIRPSFSLSQTLSASSR